MPFWKDNYNLESNIEKCEVINIGSQNIEVEYKLGNR